MVSYTVLGVIPVRMDIKKELTDSSLRIAKVADLIKAFDEKKDDEFASVCSQLCSEINYLHGRIDRAFEYVSENYNDFSTRLYNHADGHIPKLSAGQIKKLLEAVGAQDDYEVIKKPVYAEKAGVYIAEYKAAK